jgi:putative YhbY family RNA-binding protein
MKTLTPAERRALKARAHHLQPVVMIGDAGLTPKVLREIDISLKSHGLIKIRVLGDDREARAGLVEAICEPLAASPVQHIGKILVIFRPRPEDSPAAASAGRSARNAKKPAKTGGRKAPHRSKRSFQG